MENRALISYDILEKKLGQFPMCNIYCPNTKIRDIWTFLYIELEYDVHQKLFSSTGTLFEFTLGFNRIVILTFHKSAQMVKVFKITPSDYEALKQFLQEICPFYNLSVAEYHSAKCIMQQEKKFRIQVIK